jgi:hypothetical protein
MVSCDRKLAVSLLLSLVSSSPEIRVETRSRPGCVSYFAAANHGQSEGPEGDRIPVGPRYPSDELKIEFPDESGRRESNSRSQLGKLMFCL